MTTSRVIASLQSSILIFRLFCYTLIFSYQESPMTTLWVGISICEEFSMITTWVDFAL